MYIPVKQSGLLEGRRDFIKKIITGSAGVSLCMTGCSPLLKKPASTSLQSKSRVSFITGNDRREMIYQALKPFEKEIKNGIEGKQIVVKPNNVLSDIPLCATHPDAVRGLLDFLKPLTDQKIIIGESTASNKGTMSTFEEYGYMALEKEYNVRLIDLNMESYTTEWIINQKGHPNDIKIIDTFLDPGNYIISLARMKTHNAVVATLAFKNILMASPVNFYKGHPEFVRNRNEKSKMHAQDSAAGMNYNFFLLAHKVRPQFSIIDGCLGMEGNGPGGGTPVEHGVVLAGCDVISVDRVGVELMGINYHDIGYLQWCASAGMGQDDLSKIKILGPDLSAYVISYKLHENIENQLKWKKS